MLNRRLLSQSLRSLVPLLRHLDDHRRESTRDESSSSSRIEMTAVDTNPPPLPAERSPASSCSHGEDMGCDWGVAHRVTGRMADGCPVGSRNSRGKRSFDDAITTTNYRNGISTSDQEGHARTTSRRQDGMDCNQEPSSDGVAGCDSSSAVHWINLELAVMDAVDVTELCRNASTRVQGLLDEGGTLTRLRDVGAKIGRRMEALLVDMPLLPSLPSELLAQTLRTCRNLQTTNYTLDNDDLQVGSLLGCRTADMGGQQWGIENEGKRADKREYFAGSSTPSISICLEVIKDSQLQGDGKQQTTLRNEENEGREELFNEHLDDLDVVESNSMLASNTNGSPQLEGIGSMEVEQGDDTLGPLRRMAVQKTETFSDREGSDEADVPEGTVEAAGDQNRLDGAMCPTVSSYTMQSPARMMIRRRRLWGSSGGLVTTTQDIQSFTGRGEARALNNTGIDFSSASPTARAAYVGAQQRTRSLDELAPASSSASIPRSSTFIKLMTGRLSLEQRLQLRKSPTALRAVLTAFNPATDTRVTAISPTFTAAIPPSSASSGASSTAVGISAVSSSALIVVLSPSSSAAAGSLSTPITTLPAAEAATVIPHISPPSPSSPALIVMLSPSSSSLSTEPGAETATPTMAIPYPSPSSPSTLDVMAEPLHALDGTVASSVSEASGLASFSMAIPYPSPPSPSTLDVMAEALHALDGTVASSVSEASGLASFSTSDFAVGDMSRDLSLSLHVPVTAVTRPGSGAEASEDVPGRTTRVASALGASRLDCITDQRPLGSRCRGSTNSRPRSAGGDSPEEAPNEYLCPITRELMSDPVIVATGQTYERGPIRRWINSGHRTCPVTGQQLANVDLLPNYALRHVIHRWAQRRRIVLPPPEAASAPSRVSGMLYVASSGQSSTSRASTSTANVSFPGPSTGASVSHSIGVNFNHPSLSQVLNVPGVSTRSPEWGQGIPNPSSPAMLAVAQLYRGATEEDREHAVRQICSMASDGLEEGRTALAEAGAIPPLVYMVERANPTTRELAAKALRYLCRSSNPLITQAAACAIPFLAKLLREGGKRKGGKKKRGKEEDERRAREKRDREELHKELNTKLEEINKALKGKNKSCDEVMKLREEVERLRHGQSVPNSAGPSTSLTENEQVTRLQRELVEMRMASDRPFAILEEEITKEHRLREEAVADTEAWKNEAVRPGNKRGSLAVGPTPTTQVRLRARTTQVSVGVGGKMKVDEHLKGVVERHEAEVRLLREMRL
ncbi:hypothetical protein CBR_g4711 [Chara braunii]|uniref:RING-type E3 ubiquitin transferase n=1 Tax=Chara braunii TaxID=69332 RepID=A0A388KIK3_CHABU|nr:hypothetical protein CBR_g4711 [Chara braunii]|eukprot:GBG69884.1 hypothetical protein CBR_g4711 [Chara braunii]